MKISDHADRTEILAGVRADDIHKWIDGFFDAESFDHFARTGGCSDFNPYRHRKYRHCAEALEDAFTVFEGEYTREQIRAVFECHVRDDYDGFIPLREDFESGAFAEKYHEAETVDELESILSAAELSEYFDGGSYPHGKGGERKLSPGFYWRIVWPTAIAALLFASSAFTIIVPVFRNSMMKQKKMMIKELTATAASSIKFYINQEQAGKLSHAEAQRQAAAEVAELRYGAEMKDYFWITDMHPRMVMHPYRAELVGTDLTDYTDRKDKSGKKLFMEFVALVKADGEGYLEYLWQWMDNPDRAEPKLSYVCGVPEWGWVIGTGIYIHDVDHEIDRLSRNLLLADGIIIAVLLGLLVNIVLQSRRIELNRTRAESGLREAKDRYRALVESSNEGYVLEVDGETVYSNNTLRRMTGYSETELAAMKVWELLTDDEVNVPVRRHLKKLYARTAASAEFEARIATCQGGTLDVLISTSRIFFSEKNGHVISFSKIFRDEQHTLSAFCRPAGIRPIAESAIEREIAESETVAQVVQALKRLPELVRSMTDRGVRSGILRETVGAAFDAAVEYFVEQRLAEAGTTSASFAFLSLGSNARHEMTMFSDQDNALIFADVPGGQLVETRRALLALADDVCVRLKQAGYPYCPGGIMAANPKWCLSFSEWKSKFAGWIDEATPQSILEVNVFLDMRTAYGDSRFVDELRKHVQMLVGQNPGFLLHFARNCLGYKVPRLRRHGVGAVNVKECIKPIEMFARIYALKHALSVPGTLERLERLRESGVLPEETFREIAYVFDYLWQLRFFNQIAARAELNADSDELDLATLTETERENLQNVLARIPAFQTRLSYEFLGIDAL